MPPKSKTGKKPSRRSKELTYKTYIAKMAKDMEIKTQGDSKVVMDNLMVDTFQRVLAQAADLCKADSRKTLMARDVESAIKMITTGELEARALKANDKAFNNYTSSYGVSQ